MVPFTFHGDVFDVIRLPDGDVGIPLRRLCEAVGVDPEAQRARLSRLHEAGARWAVAFTTKATGTDGKAYQMAVLPRRSIPMWAATIDASRVDPDVRAKLIAYQDEAADALAAYFLDGVDRPRWTPTDFDRSRVTSSEDIFGSFGRPGRAGLTIALAEHLTGALQRGDDVATQALHTALTRLLPAPDPVSSAPRSRDARPARERLLAAALAHPGTPSPSRLIALARMRKDGASFAVLEQLLAEGALVLSPTEGYQVPNATGGVQ